MDWLDYGARWYDASIGRFPSVDRFAEKYYPMTQYQYAGNNPIVNIDVNGDSIKYANSNIEAYVDRYASPTIITKKGKVKKNKNYNADFADLISQLDASTDIFVFTDDANKLKKGDSLGEFNIDDDGNQFNVVVPDYSGEKGKLLNLLGGRGALLAEETFHATQYLNGDVEKVKNRDGTFGLSVASNTTNILVEADAKIFTANSGMAKLKSSSYLNGYTIPTMAGLIKKHGNDRAAVGILLLNGTTETVNSTFGNSSPARITYPPSYSPY